MPLPVPSGSPLSVLGRIACLALAGLFSTVLLLAAWLEPDPRGYGTHEQLGLPPCAFQVVLQIPCPTCGGTTCFAHFVRGQWRQAVHANPGMLVAAIVVTAAIPWLAASAIAGRTLAVPSPAWLFVGSTALLAAAAILTWISRLLPIAA